MRKKKINYKLWVILMIVALVAVVSYLIFYRKPLPEVYPTVSVKQVGIQDMELYGEYVGRVRAQQFVEIRARVEGYLESMLFEEGTFIKKNQILFIIDPKLYAAKADRAKAQLQKDKAIEQQTKRNIDRIRPLFEQNAASQLDLDNAIAAYESAVAAVMMSEADLRQTRMALDYTSVRSPISGMISKRHVDIGTLVGPSGQSLLATVVKSDTVMIDFSMTELDYLQSKERNVDIGHPDSTRGWEQFVTLTLADKTEYPFHGFVDFADPQVDPRTGTFSVRAVMPNPDKMLLPGQAAKVKLLLDVHKDAIVVPLRAVIIEKGGAYIYVIRPNGTAERRFIELGSESGNSIVVERGLVRGEQIVVEGYHKLVPGMKVEVVDRPGGDSGSEEKEKP